jgi:hypothetical protein
LKHPKADTIKFKKSQGTCKFRERVMRRSGYISGMNLDSEKEET